MERKLKLGNFGLNYGASVSSGYLFILGLLLLSAPLWPLIPIAKTLFVLAGVAAWIGAALFYFRNENAYFFAHHILKPGLWGGWLVFTVAMVVRAIGFYPPEVVWFETIFNLIISLFVALPLLPLFYLKAVEPREGTRGWGGRGASGPTYNA